MLAAATGPDPVAVAGLWVAIGAAVFTFGSVIVAVVALVNALLNRPRPRLEVVGNISPVSSITYNSLDESGNVVESAHDVRFTMTVTNWGNGFAHDVRLDVFGGTPALLSREMKLGNLAEKGEPVPANLRGTWSSVNGTPRLILTWWQYPGPKQYRAFPPERGEFIVGRDESRLPTSGCRLPNSAACDPIPSHVLPPTVLRRTAAEMPGCLFGARNGHEFSRPSERAGLSQESRA